MTLGNARKLGNEATAGSGYQHCVCHVHIVGDACIVNGAFTHYIVSHLGFQAQTDKALLRTLVP